MSFSPSALVRPAVIALALTVPLVAGVGAAAAPQAAGPAVELSAATEALGLGASQAVVAPTAFAVREAGTDSTGGPVLRAHFDERAGVALQDARRAATSVEGKIEDASLATAIGRLSGFREMPVEKVHTLTRTLERATARTAQQVVGYDVEAAVQSLVGSVQGIGAQAQAVAAAQAQAIAEAQAQAQAAAARALMLAQVNTPDGSRAYARDLAASQYGWGDGEFQCLDSLWMKESGWNYLAYNDGSGATGIPQSLPGSKMATFGDDWQSNAATQIAWGLDYIAKVYGSPCSAWGHSQSVNWY